MKTEDNMCLFRKYQQLLHFNQSSEYSNGYGNGLLGPNEQANCETNNKDEYEVNLQLFTRIYRICV